MALWLLGEPGEGEGFRFDVGEPYVILDERETRGYSLRMHKFRVDVTVESPRGPQWHGEIYACDYTGSAADYDGLVKPDGREVVECIVQEIMSAYLDPVEFMAMAFTELPTDTAFIKVIYDLLMYAREHGAQLEKLLPEEWHEEEAIVGLIKEMEAAGISCCCSSSWRRCGTPWRTTGPNIRPSSPGTAMCSPMSVTSR